MTPPREGWASDTLQKFFHQDKVLGGGRGRGGKAESARGKRTPENTERKTPEKPSGEKRGGTGKKIHESGRKTPGSGGSKGGTPGSGSKEYVPKTRSGAWAVLLTLAQVPRTWA